MDMLKDTVIIDVSDYEEMIRDSAKFQILKDLLINSVELNYSGDYIRIDDEAVFRAIKVVDKDALPERERKLREAWEKKHKEEDSDE